MSDFIPQWRLVLRAMQKHPGQMTTLEIAEAAGIRPDCTPQQRQARMSTLLAKLGRLGYAHVTGTHYSDYNNVRSNLWELTALGKAQPWPPVLPQTDTPRQRDIARRAREARAAEVRHYLDVTCAALGPWTPRSERPAAVAMMRARGATLQQCGDVFGVTREMARLYQLYAGREEVLSCR